MSLTSKLDTFRSIIGLPGSSQEPGTPCQIRSQVGQVLTNDRSEQTFITPDGEGNVNSAWFNEQFPEAEGYFERHEKHLRVYTSDVRAEKSGDFVAAIGLDSGNVNWRDRRNFDGPCILISHLKIEGDAGDGSQSCRVENDLVGSFSIHQRNHVYRPQLNWQDPPSLIFHRAPTSRHLTKTSKDSMKDQWGLTANSRGWRQIKGTVAAWTVNDGDKDTLFWIPVSAHRPRSACHQAARISGALEVHKGSLLRFTGYQAGRSVYPRREIALETRGRVPLNKVNTLCDVDKSVRNRSRDWGSRPESLSRTPI